ncbi:MAG: hypothetical protein IAG13_04655 [Deltaproteobacteria bacterium]|nr:hypothetical protein [Nannocystaceae bacterium]
MVTLASTSATEWTASSSVDLDGDEVTHVTRVHTSERAALFAAAEWMRARFGASTTCLGSTVTVVALSKPALRVVAT